jgi:hypothetical protein
MTSPFKAKLSWYILLGGISCENSVGGRTNSVTVALNLQLSSHKKTTYKITEVLAG